jgi:alpha-beta hydrolase superfamily lysophospholipase
MRSSPETQKMKRSRKMVSFAIKLLLALLTAILVFTLGFPMIILRMLTRPACVASPNPLSDVTQAEEHWLAVGDGHEIRVWYYPSQNGAAVIAMGGMGGALGQALPPVTPLLKAGYGVVQIDTRSCARPAASVTLGANEMLDAEAALAFLLAQPEVEAQRIGIYGFSMGGAAAIRTAARHTNIAAVVAEGGYANLGDQIGLAGNPRDPVQHFLAWWTALSFRWQTGVDPYKSSPLADISAISPRPILLIYGEHEAGTGRAEEQFAAAGEPKTLWIVPGGRHGTNYSVAADEYQARVLAFFDAALLAP